MIAYGVNVHSPPWRLKAEKAFVVLVLYLDESGDHSLSSVDPYYPVFTLSGCVFEQGYHDSGGSQAMVAYKESLFDDSSIILRSANIGRRRKGFERLKEESFRERFFSETNAFIGSLEFTVIGAVIKKHDHITQYGIYAVNPYFYSLECILERFFFLLRGRNETGMVIAESRGPVENQELEAAFSNYLASGTSYVSGKNLLSRIDTTLEFRPKSDNLLGLQIADLVAIPISHMALGKPDRPDIVVVREKMRKHWDGQIAGYGLIVLPR